MPPTLQWQASSVRGNSTDGSVFGAVEMNIGCVWVVAASMFLYCEMGKYDLLACGCGKLKISGRRSQNTQFFLVSVRYPCVSLTRFLVDVVSIIEMEEFFLLDNCSNVYQETCEAYARIPHGYQEKLHVLRRRCKDDQKSYAFGKSLGAQCWSKAELEITAWHPHINEAKFFQEACIVIASP